LFEGHPVPERLASWQKGMELSPGRNSAIAAAKYEAGHSATRGLRHNAPLVLREDAVMNVIAGSIVAFAVIAAIIIGVAAVLNMQPERAVAAQSCRSVNCWPSTAPSNSSPAYQPIADAGLVSGASRQFVWLARGFSAFAVVANCPQRALWVWGCHEFAMVVVGRGGR
jgi:hypothetical protein